MNEATMPPAEMRDRMQQIFGTRENHLFWQLMWFAEHPHAQFDATFYNHKPILEVTLSKGYARDLCAALMYDQGVQRLKDLLNHIQFSNGTVTRMSDIWTLNYMPRDLDVSGVDMTRAEDVIGFGGETLREMIRNTYHCESRAEEDRFIARWIAS